MCNAVVGVKNVDDWSFDVFQVNETGEGHALKYVGYELLQRYNLINKFKVCSASPHLTDCPCHQSYSVS